MKLFLIMGNFELNIQQEQITLWYNSEHFIPLFLKFLLSNEFSDCDIIMDLHWLSVWFCTYHVFVFYWLLKAQYSSAPRSLAPMFF